MKTAYVFLSGELKGSRDYYRELIGSRDIYCGDGGANYVDLLSMVPREIWGDMDSVDDDILEGFQKKGTLIKRFSADKDYTDGELILDYVSSKGYDTIYVVGAFGGRIDHSLTNTNLLFKYKKVKFITEEEEVFSVEGSRKLDYPSGTTISFIPFSDTVEELTLTGFKYPLTDYRLKRGDSICMSNILIDKGEVTFKEGKLLCIVQKNRGK